MTFSHAIDDPAKRAGDPVRTDNPRGRGGMARAGRAVSLLLLVGSGVAGCSNVDRAVATSAIPADYHQRHPVILTDARQSLDVFFVSRMKQLDYRQKHDLAAFSADYLNHGEGRIQVLVPRGRVDGGAAEGTLTAVRRGLAASGVTGDIEVGSYRVADPRSASVLRLSFVKLQARTTARCGDWPDDLGAGPSAGGWENRPYYNLGCATQQTLAAQIDDPRDLVQPRAEEPGDVYMRTRAIQDLRGGASAPQGQDPSTNWNTTLPQVSLTR